MSSSTCFYLRLVTQFHTDHSHLPMALPPQHGRAHQTRLLPSGTYFLVAPETP